MLGMKENVKACIALKTFQILLGIRKFSNNVHIEFITDNSVEHMHSLWATCQVLSQPTSLDGYQYCL